MWKLTISGEYQTKALGCGWLKLHIVGYFTKSQERIQCRICHNKYRQM